MCVGLGEFFSIGLLTSEFLDHPCKKLVRLQYNLPDACQNRVHRSGALHLDLTVFFKVTASGKIKPSKIVIFDYREKLNVTCSSIIVRNAVEVTWNHHPLGSTSRFHLRAMLFQPQRRQSESKKTCIMISNVSKGSE